MNKYDVAVVGDGAIGYATAYHLLYKNPDLKIAIIGPEYNFGAASWAAGGMLNLYAELEFDTLDHPLLVERFKFAKRAKDLWPAFAKALGIRLFDTGTVILNSNYSTELDDQNFDAIINRLTEDNVPHALTNHVGGVDPARLYRSKQYLHIEDEHSIDPLELLDVYTRYFEGKADFIEGNVSKVVKDGTTFNVFMKNKVEFQADKVVIAAGAASGKILAKSGVKTQKVSSALGFGWTVYCPDVKLETVVRSTNRFDACGVAVVPRAEKGVYYIGASSEKTDKLDINAPKLGQMYMIFDQVLKEINPKFAHARVQTEHYGNRPVTEDELPLLGKTSVEGLFVATGTKRDGLFMSPLIGSRMAETVLDGWDSFPEIFKPEREPHATRSKEDERLRNEMFKDAYDYTHPTEKE